MLLVTPDDVPVEPLDVPDPAPVLEAPGCSWATTTPMPTRRPRCGQQGGVGQGAQAGAGLVSARAGARNFLG